MVKYDEPISICISSAGVSIYIGVRDGQVFGMGFRLYLSGVLEGGGTFELGYKDPDYSYDMNTYTHCWTRTPAEWGLPNIRQRVTGRIEIIEQYTGDVKKWEEVMFSVEPVEEKPPTVVTPPPVKPEKKRLPDTPESLNPLDWINWLGEVIAVSLENLWVGFVEALTSAIEYLWSLVPEEIRNAIDTFCRNVLTGLAGVVSWLQDLARDPWGWTRRWLDELVKATGGTVKKESPDVYVSNYGGDGVPQTGVPWPWGGLIEVFRATVGDFKEQATRSVEGVGDATSTFPKATEDKTGFRSYRSARSEPAEVPPWKERTDTLTADYARQIVEEATRPIDELFKVASPLNEETAMTIAGSVGAAAGLVTLAGFMTGVAGELATLGQVEEIGKGVRQFIRLTGIPRLATEFVSAPLSLGVKPWVARHYDQIFRTHIYSTDQVDSLRIRGRIKRETWLQTYRWYGYPESYISDLEAELRPYPSASLLDQMHWEGHLDEKTWKETYDKLGWREEFRDAWYKTMYREPREFLLARLLDVAPDYETQIRTWIKEGGYSEESSKALISMFFRLAFKDELMDLIDQNVKDLSDGWISPGTFLANLQKLERPEKERDLRLAAAELKASRTLQERKVKISRERRIQGYLSLEEFQTELETLGLQADRIQVEVEEVQLDVREKAVRELTITEVRRLFRENLATEGLTRTRLLERNVLPADVELMLQDDYYSILKDERKGLEIAALEDLDFGSIGVQTCRERLLALKLRPEEVDLKISKTLQDHKRKVQRELEKIYTKDFQEDVMTEEQYLRALRSIALTSDAIAERLMIEKERKVPAETRGG